MIGVLAVVEAVALVILALAALYALDRKDRRHARERHVLQNRIQHPHVFQPTEDELADRAELHEAPPDPRDMAGRVVHE